MAERLTQDKENAPRHAARPGQGRPLLCPTPKCGRAHELTPITRAPTEAGAQCSLAGGRRESVPGGPWNQNVESRWPRFFPFREAGKAGPRVSHHTKLLAHTLLSHRLHSQNTYSKKILLPVIPVFLPAVHQAANYTLPCTPILSQTYL